MRRIALVFVFFLLLAALPAAAALQFGTAEFQVNTYTTDPQDDPAVCAGGDGNFVVVWESREDGEDGQDGDNDGVFGQRYDSSGSPLGGEFQVNSYTTEDQNDADVCCAGDGAFVVVWESDEEDGNSDGVFAQRFSATGAPVGGQFQVNTYTSTSQQDPRVCCADSSFVVVWESYATQDGDGAGVFGQRFASASGAPLGSEFQVSTYTSNNQDEPAVCCAADGSFVVVWEDEEEIDGSGYGVFGRRFASTGAPAGSQFQVNTYTPANQEDPAVCCGTDGSFVVAWISYEQDGDGAGVFARRFASAGSPQGGEFQVNTYTSNYQEDPMICCGADGFVVTWESNEQDGDNEGVFAQGFASSGVEKGAEIQINAYTAGPQENPVVACGPAGEVLVVWEGGDGVTDQDGSDSGVFARLLVEPLTILEIPTLAPAGLVALAGMLVFGAIVALRRR